MASCPGPGDMRCGSEYGRRHKARAVTLGGGAKGVSSASAGHRSGTIVGIAALAMDAGGEPWSRPEKGGQGNLHCV